MQSMCWHSRPLRVGCTWHEPPNPLAPQVPDGRHIQALYIAAASGFQQGYRMNYRGAVFRMKWQLLEEWEVSCSSRIPARTSAVRTVEWNLMRR